MIPGYLYECYACGNEYRGHKNLPEGWSRVEIPWPEDTLIGRVFKNVCSEKCGEELKAKALIEG